MSHGSLLASPPAEKAAARQHQTGKAKFSHPRLKKIPSFHCSLMMSKGNSRANSIISKREPNNLPAGNGITTAAKVSATIPVRAFKGMNDWSCHHVIFVSVNVKQCARMFHNDSRGLSKP
jgi:hypothetical protein